MPKQCYGHVAQLQIWGCKSSSRKFYLAHPCNEVDNTYTLFTLPGKVKHLVITVNLNGVDVSMELDTGASLSIISEETFRSIAQPMNNLQFGLLL